MNNRNFNLLLLIGIIPFFINDLYNPFVEGKVFWILDVLIFVVIPLIIYLIIFNTKSVSNIDLGFSYIVDKRFGTIGNISLFVFLLIIFPILSYIVKFMSDGFFFSLFPVNFLENSFSYLSTIPREGSKRIIIIFYMSITAGITEEFYYRALIYKFFDKYLSGKKKVLTYLFVSSLIFGLTHWGDGIVNVCSAFVIGLMFAFFYYKTRNIIILIYSHFFVDFVIYFFQ